MSNFFADAVRFTAASAGTGDFVVNTAVQGYRTPAAASVPNASTSAYRAESSDLSEWEEGVWTYASGTTTCARTTVTANHLGTTAKVNFTAAPQVALVLSSADITDAGKLQNGQFGFHNRIINPSGYVWQRLNAGAAGITDGTYAFDRWYGLTQSAGVTASQVLTAVNGTPYMMRLTQANATAQRFGIAQAIESTNCIDMRGQAVTLSASVMMSAATTLRYAIVEWTGTADAITKDVVNDWTNGAFTTGNFFISTTTTITATGSVALAANTLTPVSLTGTVSGSMNNLIAFFWTDSTQAQNVTLDIGKVQLELGSSATSLAVRSITQELQLCQRYYEKTYPMADAPGKAYGVSAGGAPLNTYVYNSANYIGLPTWSFKATKRATPTVTSYSPYTGSAGYARDSNGAQDVVVLATSNENQASIAMNGSPTVNFSNFLYAHAVASAEL